MAISNGTFADRDISTTITDTAHAVGDKVRDRIDGVGNRLGDLASKAQTGVHDAKDRVMDAKQRVSSAASDLQRNSRQTIQDNPIMAVAIGVGIGFILGRVLFR